MQNTTNHSLSDINGPFEHKTFYLKLQSHRDKLTADMDGSTVLYGKLAQIFSPHVACFSEFFFFMNFYLVKLELHYSTVYEQIFKVDYYIYIYIYTIYM